MYIIRLFEMSESLVSLLCSGSGVIMKGKVKTKGTRFLREYVRKLRICNVIAFRKPTYTPRIVFLYLSTMDILGAEEFVLGSCPVHCGMFSSIPDLCLLDASSIFLIDNQEWLLTLPNMSKWPYVPAIPLLGIYP